MKIRFLCPLALCLILMGLWPLVEAHATGAVEITNLRVEQRPGTPLVDIRYDVTAATPTVSVSLSVHDRADPSAEPLPVSSASGHIGASVPVGPDRHIEWDAVADWGPWGFTSAMEFTLQAQPMGSVLVLSGDLDFGEVTVGQTAQRTLTIQNNGNSTLTVTGIGYPDGFSGDWSGEVAAGGSQSVTVTFAPEAVQAYDGELTVASDATAGDAATPVDGSGVVEPTRIIVLSGELDFGEVIVGQTATRILTIQNTGNSPLTVTSISYPEGFSGDWSGEVAAGGSQGVTVTFAPEAEEDYSGLLIVNSDRTGGIPLRAVNGSGVVEFVLVEGGTLSTSNELDGTEVPIFHIGRHEVTWGEWQKVQTWGEANGYEWPSAANHGSGREPSGCADDHPVHSVNWYDVVKWSNARSEMEGLTPVYTVGGEVYRSGELGWDPHMVEQNLSASGYRLPLEAEWEFAARGGNQTNGYTYSGSNDLNAVGWYRNNSGGAACDMGLGYGTWPVGQKVANEIGLYDMSGNVGEWCWDRWSHSSPARHIRGGYWLNSADDCAVSIRNLNDPVSRRTTVGFRLARSSGFDVPAGFSLIPAGTYARGDHKNEPESYMEPSRPVHDVSVSAFFMARTPVTYAEWKEVYDWAVANGYTFDNAGQRGSDSSGNALSDTPENNQHPVTRVNWYDVVKWSNAKSEREGLTPVYYTNDARTTVYRQGQHDVTIAQVNWSASGYRLPTEAEWEKAARGGLVGARWPWGDVEIDGTRANYLNSGGTNGTTPVGSYAANGYDLYDMAGNVLEWNWDWHSDTWYRQAGATEADTRGPVSGSRRVVRGGSWSSNPGYCRVAFRGRNRPVSQWSNFGFRLARTQ